jgi:hypothetical protein
MTHKEDAVLQQIDTAIAFVVVMLMLSLIVMAVVQMISALTDLRGRNLASGLANLLHQIEPDLRDKLPDGSSISDYLAGVVVKHPAIAHAGTRAKAISQSELVSVLKDLCSAKPAAPIKSDAQEKLKALLEKRIPGASQAVATAEAVAKQLNVDLPGKEAEVKAAVDSAFGTVSKLEHDVGQWFDTVMNRLSDIFTRKTRVITVVISALIVIALHIDSGEILSQIVHSPELRAKLTTMSDSALSQADKIFDNSERAAASIDDMKKAHAQRSVQDEKSEDGGIVAALGKVPAHLTRCVDGRNALFETTKGLAKQQEILDEFDEECQDKTRQAMGDSYDEIRGLRTDLEKTELKIIPTQMAGNNVFQSWKGWWRAYSAKRHLAGTLVSVLFLSLGAPFWFNALRQLSNLKPAIADKVEKAN